MPAWQGTNPRQKARMDSDDDERAGRVYAMAGSLIILVTGIWALLLGAAFLWASVPSLGIWLVVVVVASELIGAGAVCYLVLNVHGSRLRKRLVWRKVLRRRISKAFASLRMSGFSPRTRRSGKPWANSNWP